MSNAHLYLCLIPESLVASMLDPQEFGHYMAVGPAGHTRGAAIFFEIDPQLKSDVFPLHLIRERCVPHPDGKPKHSLYLSIYRVLEHLPMSAIGNLYLATDDGRVLELTRGDYVPEEERLLHLYQEFCPADPCVASSLNAIDYCRMLTSPEQPVDVPRLVFSELILRDLAKDPAKGAVGDLPYANIVHLRDCLTGLVENPHKKMKMIFRHLRGDVLFRTFRNGFFVGDQNDFFYYPMPTREDLEGKYYDWWRSALVTHME